MRGAPVLSRSEKDRVRKATKNNGASIRTLAKEQKMSINELYDKLMKAPATPPDAPSEGPLVDAEFVWWTKMKPEWEVHKDQRHKNFDGDEYVALFNNVSMRIPESLAKNWDGKDISELVRKLEALGPRYNNIRDALAVAHSSDIVLELAKKEPVTSFEGEIPEPKFVPNRNGTKKIWSSLFTHPIHTEIKPTLKEQYVENKYEREGCCMLNVILNEVADAWNKKYKKTQLSYEKLEELVVGRKAGEACFADFIGLFDMLGVKAKLVNLYGHIEHNYVPEKIN